MDPWAEMLGVKKFGWYFQTSLKINYVDQVPGYLSTFKTEKQVQNE